MNLAGNWGWTPLHYAADSEHKECIQILMKQGADRNLRTTMKGWTPVHCAAARLNNTILRVLGIKDLSDAAFPAKDNNGKTALTLFMEQSALQYERQ